MLGEMIMEEIQEVCYTIARPHSPPFCAAEREKWCMHLMMVILVWHFNYIVSSHRISSTTSTFLRDLHDLAFSS